MTLEESFRELGLPGSASHADVKRAYRRLARLYHPDRHHHHGQMLREAEERMKRLNAAYTALTSLFEPNRSAPGFHPGATGRQPAGSAPHWALSRIRAIWHRAVRFEVARDDFADYAFAFLLLGLFVAGLVCLAANALESPLWIPVFVVDGTLLVKYSVEIVRSYLSGP